MQIIKEYYQKYEHTPSYNTLEQLIKSEVSSPMAQKMVLDMVEQIKEAPAEGESFCSRKGFEIL